MKSKRSFISKCMEFSIGITYTTLYTLLERLLTFYPPLFKAVNKWLHKNGPMASTGLEIEDYAGSFAEYSNWLREVKMNYQSIFYEKVEQGGKAPNPKVFSSNGAKEHNLLDFATPGRPLVLNFGSCS